MHAEQLKPMSRQLFLAIVLAIVIEGALYSALVPQLPSLTKQFALSESTAGLLMSGYSGGLVVGSVGSVPLLRWLSARLGVLVGLAAFTVSTVAFAITSDGGVLLASRLGQGVSSGLLWTACVVWLLDTSAPERRGAALGRALGYTFIGTIAGPAIGTVATQIGRPTAYLGVAGFCVVVAVWVAILPAPASFARDDVNRPAHDPRATQRSARMIALLGGWVVTFAGLCAGVINVLGPLQLSALDATDFNIGIVFVVASVFVVAVSSLAGILVDRIGIAWPLAWSCFVLIVLYASTPIFGSAASYAAVIIALEIVLFAFFVSGQTAMSRCGEAAGWSLRFSTALSAVAWGVGETLGASYAGVGMQHWGLSATVWVTAALTGLTLLGIALVIATQPGTGFQRGMPRQVHPKDVNII